MKKRKKYKKKSTAVNVKKVGQSVYKVKGGWRITKKRKKAKKARRRRR